MYTKGEWITMKWVGASEYTIETIWPHKCILIARVPDSEANANLIASAPDLYEALNALMELQGINDGRVTVRACPSGDSILKAQKALCKAEGK